MNAVEMAHKLLQRGGCDGGEEMYAPAKSSMSMLVPSRK